MIDVQGRSKPSSILFAERTEKISMNSIKAVVSEAIKDHEEYHILVCKILDCNGLVMD